MAKLSAMIRRRGRGWNVVLRHEGKRYEYGPRADRVLRDARTRNQVEEWAWRKLDEIKAEIAAEAQRARERAERAAAGLPGPMPMSALLGAYEHDELPGLAANTRKTYARSLALFRSFFVEDLDDIRADQVRAPHVRRFLKWRARDKVSARTLAKDRATLHAVFSFAARELEIVDANPVANVKKPKVDDRDPILLTPSQYEALIAQCSGHPMLALYVLVLGETGVRCDSEALWLRWGDLDIEGGFLWIASRRRETGEHRTKGGRGRWVPMTPRLKRALAEHRLKYAGKLYAGETSPWVFHHPWRRRRAKAGERIASMRRGVQAAAERAKLPAGWHLHDLRHLRVTSWLAEGANPVHVKEAVGHADLRTTMGYTHLAREHLRSLVSEPEPAEREETAGVGR